MKKSVLMWYNHSHVQLETITRKIDSSYDYILYNNNDQWTVKFALTIEVNKKMSLLMLS